MQGADEVARLMAVGEFPFVWRLVSVRPRGEESCEVELLVLLGAGRDGYRLRSVVVELDRINKVANHLSHASPPDTSFRSEDVTFATLDDALQCAGMLSAASLAGPLSEKTHRVNTVWMTGSVSRSKVRSQLDWLPQPPRWWGITKGVLFWAFWASLLGVWFVPFAVRGLMGDEVGSGDLVVALSVCGVLFAVAYPVALLGDRIERRLERPRERS